MPPSDVSSLNSPFHTGQPPTGPSNSAPNLPADSPHADIPTNARYPEGALRSSAGGPPYGNLYSQRFPAISETPRVDGTATFSRLGYEEWNGAGAMDPPPSKKARKRSVTTVSQTSQNGNSPWSSQTSASHVDRVAPVCMTLTQTPDALSKFFQGRVNLTLPASAPTATPATCISFSSETPVSHSQGFGVINGLDPIWKATDVLRAARPMCHIEPAPSLSPYVHATTSGISTNNGKSPVTPPSASALPYSSPTASEVNNWSSPIQMAGETPAYHSSKILPFTSPNLAL